MMLLLVLSPLVALALMVVLQVIEERLLEERTVRQPTRGRHTVGT